MEKLHGHTPDISMFRFSFWEPVFYYEPTAKYPKPNFLPGRFVGIAWDHGDAFTYKIWTTPNNDHTKGLELIRNVVRSRHPQESEPKVAYEDSDLAFTRAKTTTKQTSKQRKRAAKRPASDDETEPQVDTPQTFDDIGSEERGGNVDTSSPRSNNNNFNNTSKHSSHNSPSNPKRSRDDDADQDDDSINIDFDPTENEEDIEMVNEVNDELSGDYTDSEVGGARVEYISKHNWFNGELKLEVWWNTEEASWERFRTMKEDHPKLTATYMIENNVTRSERSDRNMQWARMTLRDIKRTTRRIARLYDFFLDENDVVRKIRRAQKGGNKKKKRQNYGKPVFMWGIQVPRNIKQAVEFDKQNGDSYWSDSIKSEVTALTDLECFEFKDGDFECSDDYQKTTLTMIFSVKHDLRRKSRLVAGGHLVDALDLDIYSSTVKSISVKLLHVIAHKQDLRQLCGDCKNAYVNAFTNEKVYARAGPEFGELEGSIVIILKALYGLRSSSERWHAHFADTLRSLKFQPTRYDKDVWLRLSENELHYEYVCTHSDDFMIVSKKPEMVMEALEKVYTIKSKGPPDYYLGNDYKKDSRGRWAIGCKRYLKEALARVETMFGVLTKKYVPLPAKDHPEMDTSAVLNDDEHRKFQMLIGMLNWIVSIGRFDIAHATSSLARFSSCPRKGHMDRALQVFGYLKRRSNRRIIVDSRDPIFEGGEDAFSKDFEKELASAYPEAAEEVDRKIPDPLVDEMEITVFVDSDHAHDKVTRRSITGIFIFVGRTPVFYQSKRQGAIETSSYGAEFCAMRTATEETIAVRYMLRCLGVKVTHPTYMFGDNLGVVQNATMKDSLLKKKHVAIAYHKVRESAAAGIVHPMKIHTSDNYADLLTKSLNQKTFCYLVGLISYG
jgi:hypothetical protein